MGVLSTLYIVFTPTKVSSQYLVPYYDSTYWHREVSKNAAEGAHNHGLLNISPSDFFSTRLTMSSDIEEQELIGQFFERLDNLIAVNQRKGEILANLKKAFLQRMFVSGENEFPDIRFVGFTDAWEKRYLGDYVVDYTEKTTQENQFPVLTSSQQQGIVLQSEYFSDRQVTTDENIGYFVLPRGYFTYRSRSDNNIFVFNRNDIIDKGIISYFYPVFGLINTDSNFFLRRINNGLNRQLTIAAEGTGQHVLSLQKFKKMETRFPSLPEQKQIGEFLECLDDLIAVNQREYKSSQVCRIGRLTLLYT